MRHLRHPTFRNWRCRILPRRNKPMDLFTCGQPWRSNVLGRGASWDRVSIPSICKFWEKWMACEELAHRGYRERHLGGDLAFVVLALSIVLLLCIILPGTGFPQSVVRASDFDCKPPCIFEAISVACRSHANDLERRKAPHNHHNNHNHNHHTSARASASDHQLWMVLGVWYLLNIFHICSLVDGWMHCDEKLLGLKLLRDGHQPYRSLYSTGYSHEKDFLVMIRWPFPLWPLLTMAQMEHEHARTMFCSATRTELWCPKNRRNSALSINPLVQDMLCFPLSWNDC